MSRDDRRVAFGPFILDFRERLVRSNGTVVTLAPKAVDILCVLLQADGKLTAKDELMKTVWPDTFVEENNLTVHISSLRKALGDGLIETVPRRGYRFAAPIQVMDDDPGPATVVEQHQEITRTKVTIEQIETVSAPAAGRRAWIAGLGGAAAALGLGAFFLPGRRDTGPGSQPPVASLAVLPFRPIGGAPPIGLGLTDVLITRLGGMPRVNVRSTAAVRRFAAEQPDPIEAGRALAVDAVLDGSVQQEGSRLRVVARLLRTADARQIWGQTFDQPFTSVFAIQDHLSEEIARALASELRLNNPATRMSKDAEAYRLYLMGRSLCMQHTRASTLKGIEFLKQAAQRDPGFALAHAGIAQAYCMARLLAAVETPEADQEIEAAAQKALALDSDIATAHSAFSFIRWTRFDWAGAEREWRRALELDPDELGALDSRAVQTMSMGQFDLAMKDRIHMRDLEPTVPSMVMALSWPLYYAGRYEEALVHARRAIEMDPRFARAYNNLAIIYRLMGRFQDAAETGLKRDELNGVPAPVLAGMRRALDEGGPAKLDRLRLEKALANGARPAALAGLYKAVGDSQSALQMLERAVEEPHPAFNLAFLRTFPGWAPLRKNPRFVAILKRAGLEPPRLIASF